LNEIRKRLGEVFVCVFLDECVDKVRGGSAQSGVVNRGDLDEAFLEKGRRAPALCDLGSTSLSFITFSVALSPCALFSLVCMCV